MDWGVQLTLAAGWGPNSFVWGTTPGILTSASFVSHSSFLTHHLPSGALLLLDEGLLALYMPCAVTFIAVRSLHKLPPLPEPTLSGSHYHGTHDSAWASLSDFCFLLQLRESVLSRKPPPLAGSLAHGNFSRKDRWLNEWTANEQTPLLKGQSGAVSSSCSWGASS